jgi:hypothetical protein
MALLSMDEIPEAIACIRVSFELDPTNPATHRFIVSDLAIPLHKLMFRHYYKEEKKKKKSKQSQPQPQNLKKSEDISANKTNKRDTEHQGSINQEQRSKNNISYSDNTSLRVSLNKKTEQDDKKQATSEKGNVNNDNNGGGGVDSSVELEELEISEEERSKNKFGLSREELKELEDKVIEMRAQVSVQEKINEINYRGLSLIDKLVQTALWRRATRLKLLLMRSARFVHVTAPIYIYVYIYIHMPVRVCVCVCSSLFIIIIIIIIIIIFCSFDICFVIY